MGRGVLVAVAVHVDQELNLLLFHYLSQLGLHEKHLGVTSRVLGLPHAVEINTVEIASVVAETNPVDVDHGEYVEAVM